MMSQQTKSELQQIKNIKEHLIKIINDKNISFRWNTSDYNPSELKYVFTGANNLMAKNLKHSGLHMEITIQKLYDRASSCFVGTEVILKTTHQEDEYPMDFITRTREFLLYDFDLFVPIKKRYNETYPDITRKYKPVSEQYEKIKKYLVDFEITKNIKTK